MPLLWISLSFIFGIIFANFISLPTWVWILISAFFFSCFIFFFARKSLITKYAIQTTFPLSIFYFLLFFFLGSAYYQFRQPNVDAFHIAFYNDRNYEVLITGYVAEAPDYRDTYTNLKIQTEFIDTGDGDLPVSGLILVRVQPNEIYEYGQRLRLRGRLLTPPVNEDFSYKDYLARQYIYATISKTEVTRLPNNRGNFFLTQVYNFKNKLIQNTYQLFQDPEASLFAGILFGVDTGLPKDLQQAFKNTGTAHIIAISGFNIAIIAGIFLSIFKTFLGERWGALVAIMGVFLYAFFSWHGRRSLTRRHYGEYFYVCHVVRAQTNNAEFIGFRCRLHGTA
ncbi:MAG: DNA internalization-like competence protein ComEC/Rec2 [Chloroflexi bacterium OLB14]|nr:MAG: DNA internalization-like competence protein ComEC/Rec2 [Chloroflexi bacterium OLB14]